MNHSEEIAAGAVALYLGIGATLFLREAFKEPDTKEKFLSMWYRAPWLAIGSVFLYAVQWPLVEIRCLYALWKKSRNA